MHQYQQVGGVKCGLCGSDGTNKSTCPLNKSANAPNPLKHPNAVKQITTTLAAVKASPPVKASRPVKVASPVKVVSPVKVASPVKAVSPIKVTKELINHSSDHDDDDNDEKKYNDYEEVQQMMKLDPKKITFGDVSKFVTLGAEAFDESIYTKPIYAVEMRHNRKYLYEAAEPLIEMLNKLVGKQGPYIFMTSFAEHAGGMDANLITDYYGNEIFDYDMIEIGKPNKAITIKDIRDALKNYENEPDQNRSYFYEYASNNEDMNRIELGYGS